MSNPVEEAARSAALMSGGNPPGIHVPHRKLGNLDVETKVTDLLRLERRLALVAPTGGGKSSLLTSVLHEDRSLMPVHVTVTLERDPDIARKPMAFARHLLAEARSVLLAPEDRGVLSSQATTKGKGAKAGVSVLNAEARAEVQTILDYAESSSDVFETLSQLFTVVRSNGYKPIVVLDDTDKWTRASGADEEDKTSRVAFFGEVVRVLSEPLQVGAVVTVHPSYRTGEWVRIEPLLGSAVEVPRLRHVDAVNKIVTSHLSHAGISEPVFTDEALHELFKAYEQDDRGDIRTRILTLGHNAIELAEEAGADAVESIHAQRARQIMTEREQGSA